MKVCIETYSCSANVSYSEIMAGLLGKTASVEITGSAVTRLKA